MCRVFSRVFRDFCLFFSMAVSQGGWDLALVPFSCFCLHLVCSVYLGPLRRETYKFSKKGHSDFFLWKLLLVFTGFGGLALVCLLRVNSNLNTCGSCCLNQPLHSRGLALAPHST